MKKTDEMILSETDRGHKEMGNDIESTDIFQKIDRTFQELEDQTLFLNEGEDFLASSSAQYSAEVFTDTKSSADSAPLSSPDFLPVHGADLAEWPETGGDESRDEGEGAISESLSGERMKRKRKTRRPEETLFDKERPREKVRRRRQIDPTTCERDYSLDEIEFMNALDDYKRTSGRMFPTCSEILEVIRSLGYIKVSHEEKVEEVPEPGKMSATPLQGATPALLSDDPAGEEEIVTVFWSREPEGETVGGVETTADSHSGGCFNDGDYREPLLIF